jgi:hypothetical protein
VRRTGAKASSDSALLRLSSSLAESGRRKGLRDVDDACSGVPMINSDSSASRDVLGYWVRLGFLVPGAAPASFDSIPPT